ncbi:MAG: hypothetical protein E5Y73_03345 [Mesorhizobium sp.]|nr:hypothetical protein [Mesorhizobium sp.]TIL96196.1 MAG: hypothetical protein E5Y73_03345 [Mesorhizobium sp.]
MRARDTGEIITWSVVALGLLAPLLWSFWQSRPRQQALGSVFLLLFACLVGFAVAVDMLHFLTGSKLVGYAEDGGEMLSIAGRLLQCVHPLSRAGALCGSSGIGSEPAVLEADITELLKRPREQKE